MTTIVYDHKARQIAVDGQTSCGTRIANTEAVKWVKDGDDIWFCCGSTADRDRFIDHIKSNGPDAPRWPIDNAALLVSCGRVIACGVGTDGEPWQAPVDYSDATGSGGDWALAAIDFGCTAKQAIAYAATRDTGTGGRISVFDVAAMKFIEGGE